MEGEESPGLLQMPLIQRLDRLDGLLQNLEKQGLSGRHNSTATDSVQHEHGEQQCKPLASVLGEVPSKGSLMERVAMLEKRLLQLYVEIGGGEKLNSGRISLPESSKSTCAEGSREAVSDASSVKNGQGMLKETGEEVKSPGMSKGPMKRSRLRANSIIGYRRWLGWFHLGC